ncbi:hypothetical protein SAMN05421770_11123 [Granulicella rosea]|uniref:Lipocalin-like domain-containing protein n=1 Tax=Granulicella rosea TaxID=474952 RepID=A0A239MA45_9BACT|nr:hypothetical protein [Granulicella rosea]SNT39511.1 hypothetical protein SAMN05421770_11123 [Granulicella rosea]
MSSKFILRALVASLAFSLPAAARQDTQFTPLSFLFGTWSAATAASGATGATALGDYTFRPDLKGKVITRTGSLDACKGPQGFDCDHHDMLTIYPENGALHAIYFDNEGHTIHYDIATPDANTAVFLSNTPGPQFRLIYHLEGKVMTGKFQFAPPGSKDFTSYLEWSGARK